MATPNLYIGLKFNADAFTKLKASMEKTLVDTMALKKYILAPTPTPAAQLKRYCRLARLMQLNGIDIDCICLDDDEYDAFVDSANPIPSHSSMVEELFMPGVPVRHTSHCLFEGGNSFDVKLAKSKVMNWGGAASLEHAIDWTVRKSANERGLKVKNIETSFDVHDQVYSLSVTFGNVISEDTAHQIWDELHHALFA